MRRAPEDLTPGPSSDNPSLPATLTVDSRSETHAAEDKGLLALWHERAIDLSRLSRPPRLAVAVSVLAALVSATLIMLRDVPQPHLLVPASGAQPNAPIPTAAFAVAFALWLIAWSAALTGALFGHWALRLFVFAAFLYVSIDSIVLHAITLIYLAPLFVVAVWMIVLSILQWRWHRIAHPVARWLPVVTFIVTLACYAAHYALVWWAGAQVHDTTKILSLLVTVEFEAYTFVLLPVLFLTGSDFAEWSEAVAAQGIALLRRFRSAWPLAGAVIVVATAILVHELIDFGAFAHFDLGLALHLASLGIYGCIVILLCVGIARLGRIGSWPRLAVPPGALVAATVLLMGVIVTPAYLSDFILSLAPASAASVDYTVFRHAGTARSPAFSMAYPSDWRNAVSEPTNAQDILLVGFVGPAVTGDPQLFVIGLPAAGESGIAPDQIAQEIASGICTQKACTATLGTAPNHGPWIVERTVVHEQQSNGQPVERDGDVWMRTDGTTFWALYGSAQPAGAHAAAPIFTAMVDAWRPNLTAVAPATPAMPGPSLVTFLVEHEPTAPIAFGLIPLALGLLVGVPLLVRGRRRPGPLAMAGLFLVVLGLREALVFLPQILAQFGVPTDRIVVVELGGQAMRLSQIPVLSVPELQALAAFFTVVIAGWFIVRRRIADGRATRMLAALLLLNVGLQIINWLDLALSASDQLTDRFTVAQGVLLVLAFLWDLLTSGEQVTNAQGRQTPRYARVLIYVGYSMLSFSQVLFFTTLRGSSTANFESGWTDIGLTVLGIALLLTVVLLRLARSGVTTRATPSDLGGADEGTLEQAAYVQSGLHSFGSSQTSPA